MRKSTLFVSAALTTFMLVMLFGVVSAYQAMTKTNPINVSNVAQQQPVSSVVEPAPALEPTSQAAPVTPEQAAQLAVQAINRTDLYSVETSKLNDVEAFLVTFSSGDLVYVSLTGQILSITKLPVVTVSTGSGGGRRNNGGGGGSGGGGGEHEGGDEHEDGDDD